jgi:hypothetical protein
VTLQLVIFAGSLNVAAVCMLQNVQIFYDLVIKNKLLICCAGDCMLYIYIYIYIGPLNGTCCMMIHSSV